MTVRPFLPRHSQSPKAEGHPFSYSSDLGVNVTPDGTPAVLQSGSAARTSSKTFAQRESDDTDP